MRREGKDKLNAKTRVFASRKNCSIYRKSVDWMTIRLSENSELIKMLDKHDMLLTEITDAMQIMGGIFKIKYFDTIMSGMLKVFHILDVENNQQIGCIHIRQKSEKKTKNVFTDIELVGHFWTCYAEKFDEILELVGASKYSRNIVSRIDYAVDFMGPEVSDMKKYERESKKRESAENALGILGEFNFSEDGEFMMIPKKEIEKIKEIMDKSKIKKRSVGSRDTYKGVGNDRHELYIYDKKLDILDKEKYKLKITNEKTGESKQPYLKTLKEKGNITRIEYKMKSRSIREMEQNSIAEILEKIEDLAIDYMEDYYDLDFRFLCKRERSKICRNEEKVSHDRFMEGILKKKTSLSLAMFRAYAEKYIAFKTEKDFFGQLYSIFGERLVDNIIKHHIEFPKNHAFDYAFLIQDIRQGKMKLSTKKC